MQICLIGDFSPNLDEGYKNVSYYLAKELETRLDLQKLDVKKVNTAVFWKTALSLHPKIAHLIAQPTLMSLLFIIISRLIWKDAKTVLSSLRPERFFSSGMKLLNEYMLRLARPDLVLVQSHDAKEKFTRFGCRVEYLSNGVDINRFSPILKTDRSRLRAKYNLNPDLPIVLHVGHLQKSRNLESLIPLQAKQIQVIVAGSIYMGVDQSLIDRLEASGIRIFRGFQPNVEEIYQLADCYVFPLEPGNSLSMPLSVLEAMACNLRVVSTRFKGLETAFTEGNGLKFINTPEDVSPVTLQMLFSEQRIQTRDKVQSFSWGNLASQLCNYYLELSK